MAEPRPNGLSEDVNRMHGMMVRDTYGDFKFDKEREINNGMTIMAQAENEYQQKISGIGGSGRD